MDTISFPKHLKKLKKKLIGFYQFSVALGGDSESFFRLERK